MSSIAKNLMFWMVAALVIFVFWNVSSRIQKNERQLSFSDFMVQVEREHVKKVTITGSGAGSQIVGEFKNGQGFRTFAPPQVGNLVNTLLGKDVEVNARDANSSSWVGHIISWTPIVIMIAFLIFFMRQMANSPAASNAARSLELRARIHELLSGSDEDLSKAQILAKLSNPGEEEMGTALYQMLREGTVLFTAERKYRVKTVE
jgi:cell division protease FtsH